MNKIQKISVLSALLFMSLTALGDDKIIQVKGSWKGEITDDRGEVTLSVSTINKDLKRAQRDANLTYNKILKSAEKLRLKDAKIESTHYTVEKEYTWEKDKRVFVGHRVNAGVKVTTSEINRIGEAIVAGEQAGANEIGDVNTYVSLKKRETVYREGLINAMKDAEAKADLILKAAKAKRGKVVSVIEGSPVVPVTPRPMMITKSLRAASNDAMPAPEIKGGESVVNVVLTATYEIDF